MRFSTTRFECNDNLLFSKLEKGQYALFQIRIKGIVFQPQHLWRRDVDHAALTVQGNFTQGDPRTGNVIRHPVEGVIDWKGLRNVRQ